MGKHRFGNIQSNLHSMYLFSFFLVGHRTWWQLFDLTHAKFQKILVVLDMSPRSLDGDANCLRHVGVGFWPKVHIT